MKKFEEYAQFVDDVINALDYSASRPANLYEPITYTLKSGGKHLRPILLAAFADAFGADYTRLTGSITAIEMFHNFTLLHDDIMDKSPMRHGRQTVWKKWGEPTAILAGDTMLTMSNMLMGDSGYLSLDQQSEMHSSFNVTAVKVYRGQQFDMDFDSRDDVTIDEYIMMIGLKTSALLGGACHLGAVAANADRQSRSKAYDYGFYLGLAFQLQDDLLDTFGDPATFGKPIGGDIVNNKKTWLNIMATTEAPQRMREAALLEGQAKIDAVRNIYTDLNLPTRCEKMIDDYLQLAIDHLGKVNMPEANRQFFVDFAHKLAGRKK